MNGEETPASGCFLELQESTFIQLLQRQPACSSESVPQRAPRCFLTRTRARPPLHPQQALQAADHFRANRPILVSKHADLYALQSVRFTFSGNLSVIFQILHFKAEDQILMDSFSVDLSTGLNETLPKLHTFTSLKIKIWIKCSSRTQTSASRSVEALACSRFGSRT